VTDEDVTALISELALASTVKNFSPPGMIEKIAEAAALEILFPFELRKELLVKGEA
jgi:hypothetical protein